MILDRSCNIILKQCMSLNPTESCLIITDFKLKSIGFQLFKNSSKITKKLKLITIPIPEAHGSEPPKKIANEMLNYDVILMPTTKSLSHTKARENASSKGARIASMPGITSDMMERALNVNFNKIKSINNKLIKRLQNKNKITIKTKLGTDIAFYTKGRKWISDNGIYIKKGSFGNLPAGEVFIAPLEGKTDGVLVCDASIGGLGKAGKNIKITVKGGTLSRNYLFNSNKN